MQTRRFLTLQYIVLFGLAYLTLMFIGGYIIRMLEVPSPSISNMVVIVASTLLVNALFLRREKRHPTRNEYIGLVLGATLVDLALEIYTLSYSNGPLPLGGLTIITLGHTLLFAIGFYPRGKRTATPSAA